MTPDNAGYYMVAYLAAAVIYLGYGLTLLARRRKHAAWLDAEPRDTERKGT